MDSLEGKKLLGNRFEKCGLHPFNVYAVNFTKIFKCRRNIAEPEIVKKHLMNMKKTVHIFESFIDDSKIKTFKQNKSCVWNGPMEDKSLFDIWYKLSHQDFKINDP